MASEDVNRASQDWTQTFRPPPAQDAAEKNGSQQQRPGAPISLTRMSAERCSEQQRRFSFLEKGKEMLCMEEDQTVEGGGRRCPILLSLAYLPPPRACPSISAGVQIPEVPAATCRDHHRASTMTKTQRQDDGPVAQTLAGPGHLQVRAG